MNNSQTYGIDIGALANGKHIFDFSMNDAFFASIEQDIITKGSINSSVALEKTDLLIRAKFINHGSVELICDRTLLPFYHEIKSENTLTFNFSDRNEELNDEIVLIRRDTNVLDVSNYIYEFIILAIPLKKIHPDYRRKDEDESNDNILIYSSLSEDSEPEDTNIDILDPRWEALKKLKDSL